MANRRAVGRGTSAEANLPWRVERLGVEAVPERARAASPADLFWLWFAADIGILGVVYGALLVDFHLDLLQGLLAVAAGGLSFALVGVLGVAGVLGHAPMLTLSRAVFGVRGNLAPAFVSWLALVGWEAVSVVGGTLALAALVPLVGPFGRWASGILALAVVLGLSLAFGILGHATLVRVERAVAYVFGAFTVVVLALLLPHADLGALVRARPASWLGAFLPAATVIVAASGLSWANTAADYSRYLPDDTAPARVILATTAGGGLPLAALMVVGFVLAAGRPGIAAAANPLAALGALLPRWAEAPYLLTAAAGMVAQADLGLYSSGLNLQALGVPLRRSLAVLVDGTLVTLATVAVLFGAGAFLAPFTAFVLLLGVGIAAWAGVFLADLARRGRRDGYPAHLLYGSGRRGACDGVAWGALGSWAAAVAAGLLVRSAAGLLGPLGREPLGAQSVGVILAFVAGAVGGLAVGTRRGSKAAGERSRRRRSRGRPGHP